MRTHIGLSGEQLVAEVLVGQETDPHANALQVAAINVQKREYQKLYMEYWNSTAEHTGTGRPVDGLLCPVAPHASVTRGKYKHYGYSSFVNVLDYTSVVIPVTHADKQKDRWQSEGDYLSEIDREIHAECEYRPCTLTHTE